MRRIGTTDMKALMFHKPGDVRVETIDDPKIETSATRSSA